MVDSLKNNLIPNEPTLKDALDQLRKDVMLSFNAHHIGTVQEFDPVRQVCKATINYKKAFSRPDSTGVYKIVLDDYPILIDCPTVILGGGDGCLTFPISPGDECLVLFNDRDFDNWFAGNSGGSVATGRLHSFSDGLILVGVRSLANVIPGYNPTGTELRNKDGSSRVTIEDNGDITLTTDFGFFTFKANSDVVFNTGTVQGQFGAGGKVKFQNVFGDLVTAIFNIIVSAEAGGFPLVVSPTDLAVLLSFKP